MVCMQKFKMIKIGSPSAQTIKPPAICNHRRLMGMHEMAGAQAHALNHTIREV